MKYITKNIGYAFLLVMILFNNIIAKNFEVFNYFDELITLICILIVIINMLKYKKVSRIIICLVIIVVIGLLGNMVYSYQESMIAIFKDILAFAKMGIVYVALYYKRERTDNYLILSQIICKVYLTIIFICGLISMKKDIGMSYDLRNGILSYKFLYTHPTFLVYAVVIMLVIIAANSKSKLNIIFALEGLFVLYLTQRDKAFGFIVLYVLIMFLFRFAKKIRWWHIAIAISAMVYVSFNKIVDYLNYSWSPRWALYTNGVKILKDTFPLGSGFSTFACALSGMYYSLAYYIYDMYGRVGVSPFDYENLGDAQWPYYYAQFGLIGCIIFVYILYTMFKGTRSIYKFSEMKLKASYLLMGYMIIASLVENVFTNETGVTFVLVLLLFLGRNGYEYEEDIRKKSKSKI